MIQQLIQFFRLIRVHQWSKNLLLFVPLIVSPELENLFLYESMTDKLIQISPSELSNLMLDKKPAFRHWIQGLKGTKVEDLITQLSPRLAYIFK